MPGDKAGADPGVYRPRGAGLSLLYALPDHGWKPHKYSTASAHSALLSATHAACIISIKDKFLSVCSDRDCMGTINCLV